MAYRKCFICSNDSVNSPGKIFVRVREDLRENWCRLANVEYFRISLLYCCEDHIDPHQDLKNYYKCKLLNDEPILKRTALLRNIDLNVTQTSEPASYLQQLLLQSENPMPSSSIPATVLKKHEDLTSISRKRKIDVYTQCNVEMVDKSTNYKIRKIQPSVTSARAAFTAELPSPTQQQSSSTETSSLFGCTSETDDSTSKKKLSQFNMRLLLIDLISRKPKMYLGLPKPYFWLIDYVVEKSIVKTSSLCLIMTLFKIKQNDTIERMSDQFQLSRVKISNLFLQGIEVLTNFFQNLIFIPSPNQIKINLPLVFKIKYSDVQMIIDCFEIQIVKPSNPRTQAQTWSQYKGCNTIKYLIGCLPNGFVSFISSGFGGRISDKAIVEISQLIDILEPNSVIMADRGFKEIESQLNRKYIKLLRPPTVYTGTKQTKAEALESKVIASLRVHVERVIRRIREFSLLKPHSVVNYKYVSYLDEAVIIACGLINLQGEIIKKT